LKHALADGESGDLDSRDLKTGLDLARELKASATLASYSVLEIPVEFSGARLLLVSKVRVE
jgi:hypothetical protein